MSDSAMMRLSGWDLAGILQFAEHGDQGLGSRGEDVRAKVKTA
jgi:hypothetical protein